MTIEKRIVEAPYMTSALRREAAEEITRLRNALAQIVKIGAEHREGRLKALEWMAALESRLREIGDLAASCRTGPALREAMAQIETMTDMRHNVVVDAAIYCSEKRPIMKWQLVPVEPTPEMIWKAEEDSPEFNHGDPWYGSEPPSEGQIRAIYTAMLEAAQQPEPLSDERIFDLLKQVDPHAVRLPLGFKQFAIAIEREILGGGHE